MNRITDYKKLAEDITLWIREYTVTNNIKSLVVGVSGGIDSAVVSTLCAMTGLHTEVVVIPIHSAPEHTRLAEVHTQWLSQKWPHTLSRDGATAGFYDMSKVFDCIAKESYFRGHNEFNARPMANIKSRLRMLALYYRANYTGGMVVGTGNKVEDFGVGFCTLGGDHQVDISPIADLYKTEVRELGRYLGIAQEILDAQPTDGLWSDNRTDEQQLSCTYEELEWAMDYDTITHLSELYSKTNFEGLDQRQQEVIRIYRKLNRQNQHKMLPIPIYKLPL